MTNLSLTTLALTIAGSLVGAGFASGQELWQFFGTFHLKGIFGLVLSLSLFALLSSLFLVFCIKNKLFSYEEAVFPNTPQFVKASFSFLENLLFFFLCVIMMSGATEAVKSLFSENTSRIFSIFFALSVAVFTLLGLSGLTRVFSLFVPILIVISLIVFAVTLKRGDAGNLTLSDESQGSGLLTNFFVSSLLYLSYSFFASVGLLSPLARRIKDKKTAVYGSVLGMVLLILVSLSILFSMLFNRTAKDAALPMLEIAKGVSPLLGYAYSGVLILAMFAAALTSSVAFFEWFDGKVHIPKVSFVFLVFLFSLSSWLMSRLGFTNLISTVYPIYGYVGFVIIAAVVFNSLRRRKNG